MTLQIPNLALKPNRWPVSLEKWYIGTFLKDGTILSLCFSRTQIMGFQWAQITAELHRPKYPIIYGEAEVRVIRGGGEVLQCGSARIDQNKLYFETPTLTGQLLFSPRFPPTKLANAEFKDGNRKFQWEAEIPAADVSGHLSWCGGELSVEGRGFRNRIYYDMLPWLNRIHELKWGHVLSAKHTAIWLRIRTNAGLSSSQWLNGEPYPNNEPIVDLSTTQEIARADIATLSGLPLGRLTPLISKLCGNPTEVKHAGQVFILGDKANAISGAVTWDPRSVKATR